MTSARTAGVNALALSAFVAVVALPGLADARLAAAGAMESRFVAVGPAGLKIVGTTQGGSVTDDGATVHISVPLGGLTTGIALRDRHMREKYLEVGTYPDASLDVARSAITFPKGGTESTGDVPGVLRLHGQNKNVTVHYTAKRSGETFSVSGAMHINMNDFAIEMPKYMGITVKPDIDVTVTFGAADRP